MKTPVRLAAAFAAALALAACGQKPKPAVEASKAGAPKAETPHVEAPKAEAPKAEVPKAEAPKAEVPKAEAPRAEAAKDGWTSLFDGKSLKNWKAADFTAKGEIEVKDGELLIHMGQPMTGIVWDGGEILRTDYEISLEAKKVDGTDFFCALTFPVGKDPCTFVCGGWGGVVVGLSCVGGYDASENQTTKTKEFEKGRWYKIHVRVTKAKIECWIDGEKFVDLELADQRISIRIECEPCVPLGVATFNTTGALRNIQVRKVEGPASK